MECPGSILMTLEAAHSAGPVHLHVQGEMVWNNTDAIYPDHAASSGLSAGIWMVGVTGHFRSSWAPQLWVVQLACRLRLRAQW